MGDHVSKKSFKKKVSFLAGEPLIPPFTDTIVKIVKIRHDIDDLRKKDVPDFETQLIKLEEALRASYAKLAASAASKVAKWEPSPKKPKPKR